MAVPARPVAAAAKMSPRHEDMTFPNPAKKVICQMTQFIIL